MSSPILKAGLTFDEENHEYYWQLRNVPGISKILKKLKLTKDYEGVDPYYAQRGKVAHLAIEYDLAGELDFDSLDPALKPFVTAWRAFVAKHKYEPMLTERMFYSKTQDYAGRIDHYGAVDGLLTTFDVKCSKKHDPDADYQVCGQVYGLAENGFDSDQQGILELHDDGTFSWFPAVVDLNIWPSVMTLWRRKLDR